MFETKSPDMISIIVPVYNAQSFIGNCIDSILKQTYSNFELLLIDDGSSDESGTICEEYARHDFRIKVYHKENGGPSEARNYGIDCARSDYVAFVDSDDYVAPQYLETLVGLIAEYSAQMACVDSFMTYQTDDSRVDDGIHTTQCLSPSEALKCVCIRDGFGVAPWGKIFDKRLFDVNRFPVGQLYEDLVLTPRLICLCERVAVSSRKLYYWVQREGSIMHHPVQERDMRLMDYLNDLVDFVDETYPEQHEAAVCRCIDDIFTTIVHRLLYQENYFEQIGWIRKNSEKYWKEGRSNRYLSRNKKIQWMLLTMSPRLYRLVYRMVDRMRRNSLAN